MRVRRRQSKKPFRVLRAVEIDCASDLVYACWTDFENLPRLLENVRRVKRIDEQHTLWDADVAGRQVVWEARTVEIVPEKSLRWESVWGARHRGEVRFEAIDAHRTRLVVDMRLHPEGLLENLGVRLGLVGAHVGHDLDRFRQHVEDLARDHD